MVENGFEDFMVAKLEFKIHITIEKIIVIFTKMSYNI